MRISKVTSRIGAEISEIDLSRLQTEQVTPIKKALTDHTFLLFRGQKLTDDNLIAFSRHFGELDPPPNQEEGRMSPAGYPDIYVVSNIKTPDDKPIGALGAGEAVWHTDMSYLENPPIVSMLYALEIPKRGGNTWLCNMHEAWKILPAETKSRLADLKIKHDGTFNSGGYVRQGVTPSSDPYQSPGAWHPAVCKHPDNGAAYLYLGRRRNAFVDGMSPEESDELLDELWGYATHADNCYAHEWQVGDLVVWDNRLTMHRRDAFDESERRLMHRTQIKGRDMPERYAAV